MVTRRTRANANRRGAGNRAGRNGGDDRDDAASSDAGYPSAPELVVVARREAGLRARRGGISSSTGEDVSALADALPEGVTLEPLFGRSEERLIAEAQMMSEATDFGAGAPDLSVFYRVEAPAENLEELAESLREQPTIEAAYVKPPAEPPQLNDMVPTDADAPPATPDFTAGQLYLGAAPGGIEATYAQTRPGGRGANVRIIDIEGAWRFSHEDLMQNQGGVVGGVQNSDIRWRNHGTAVVGVYGGDANTIGIRGICPDANTRAYSIFLNAAGTSANSAQAIRNAANMLSPGDILLIELHRPGPRNNFQQRQDQLGYIAIEWWEDDFAAIRYAVVNRGVIVVEAAGNGAENLDDALYNVRPAGFPAGWTNPFRRSNRDSGAILVGAGAPPPGTHGRNHGPDRSRLDFSNYGASVDAQGWGREVTTTGYGNLQGGGSEDLWYTDTFSGTSSASPIVVGALGCVQGNRRARGLAPYTPAQARQQLRATGSPQQDAPGRPATQRIGNRPNLRQLIPGPTKTVIKDAKNEKIEIKDGSKEIKVEIKEKVEFKEQGKDKIEKIEQKEGKEIKLEKNERKELKIEVKEGGKSEFEKQFDKQLEKQIDKQLEKQFEKNQEKLREGGIGGGGGFGGSLDMTGEEYDAYGSGTSVEERLARIEAALGIGMGDASMTGFESEAEMMPAPIIPPPIVCTAFGGMPVGVGPNPRTGNQARFFVRGSNGLPTPTTRIINMATPSGVHRGLDCGFSTEIRPSSPASQVTLALVSLTQPVIVQVFNGATPGATTILTPPVGTVRTVVLSGANITRVVIRAPRDRTLLIRFCFRRIIKKIEIKETKEKSEKIEIKELKEKEQKEGKEIKEFKEGAKEIKEGSKEVFDKQKDKDKDKDKDAENQPPPDEAMYGGGDFYDYSSGIDPSAAGYEHFIGADLRPDLSGGALTGEEDLQGGEM